MGDILTYVNLGMSVLILVFSVLLVIKNKKSDDGSQNKEVMNKLALLSDRMDNISRDNDSKHSALRSEISKGVVDNVSRLGDSLRDQQEKQLNSLTAELKSIEEEFGKIRSDTLEMLGKMQKENSDNMERFRSENKQTLFEVEQKLEKSRTDTTETLNKMQASNTEIMEKLRAENRESLDKINDTVNEKLQKTLNDRISQSFEAVNSRLTEVYRGLGEMKQVAQGVTDLKKVLSNVKTRGIMGEIQLGSILAEILAPEQYDSQVPLYKGASEKVDYAVKLPGADKDSTVWLPIDSKFPGDTYLNLQNAYEGGNSDEIKEKRKLLFSEAKRCAKSIRDKYIKPPYTTDFAIMFLPFEGLYAEIISLGLVEELQRDFKINVAGPSTMAAMLNSLQMGFKTLAIQQKSSEVWSILEKAKAEFSKFGEILDNVHKRLNQADEDLERLIGTRTKAINKTLANVALLESSESKISDDDNSGFFEGNEE